MGDENQKFGQPDDVAKPRQLAAQIFKFRRGKILRAVARRMVEWFQKKRIIYGPETL
jgi:hypothetical protein